MNSNCKFHNLAEEALVCKPEDHYYPFGMVMPGREFASETYRHGYQGEFAEKDEETGYDFFELRLWDGRIGRWMTTDPYAQYHSPYLGMGNNPVNSIDPDGGMDNMPWYTDGEGGYIWSDNDVNIEGLSWFSNDRNHFTNLVGDATYFKMDVDFNIIDIGYNLQYGYAISIINGAYIDGFGGMFDKGYVNDSYGKDSYYLTIGGAVGYGGTIGSGFTYLGKDFKLEDFDGMAVGVNISLPPSPLSLEGIADIYETYNGAPIGDNFSGKGVNIGIGKAYYGYLSYTFFINPIVPNNYWTHSLHAK